MIEARHQHEATSSSWYGFFAPKGTPKAIIDKINRDLQKVIDMPDMKERELRIGLSLHRRPAGAARDIPQDRDREVGRPRQEGLVQVRLQSPSPFGL